MKENFRKVANHISVAAGNAGTFLIAISIVIVWGLTGPVFNYSNTWQLAINTTTTIVTFLMVFLIQNTQNRDARAMQLKLDELLRAGKGRDSFIDIEDMTDSELIEIGEEFQRVHANSDIPAIKKLHTKIKQVHKERGL